MKTVNPEESDFSPEWIELYRKKCRSDDAQGSLKDLPPEETITRNGRIPANANDWDYVETMNDILVGLQTRKAEWGREKAAELVTNSISRADRELILSRLCEIFKIVTGNYLEDVSTDLDSIVKDNSVEYVDLSSPPLETNGDEELRTLAIAAARDLEFKRRSSVKATMIKEEEPDEEDERDRKLGDWNWVSLENDEIIEQRRKRRVEFQKYLLGETPEALDHVYRHRRIVNTVLESQETTDRLKRISQWLSVKRERGWPEHRVPSKIFQRGDVLTLADLRAPRR